MRNLFLGVLTVFAMGLVGSSSALAADQVKVQCTKYDKVERTGEAFVYVRSDFDFDNGSETTEFEPGRITIPLKVTEGRFASGEMAFFAGRVTISLDVVLNSTNTLLTARISDESDGSNMNEATSTAPDKMPEVKLQDPDGRALYSCAVVL